ncbi:ionotropic receptor 20a-related [Holotrichia oblita]|uniref:Ionotropic receptor 20a-related n=1 Tax=Holotrichia oblita TaxID=644536 RepID=A0ACB9T661_HOLOL|nr:ionotropic receptor 20a-related [Holotrichia oblita]
MKPKYLNNLIIIILTQDNPYNIKLATNLKNNIENQALNLGNKELIPVIYQSHIDFPVIGDWTILPLIPKLNSLHSNNISWYIFIDDITEIRLVKLLQTLDKYNPEEKIWLGHALHDEECTIIHHFAFYPDPKWFKYPNIASGVAFSKAMLSWCSDRLILDPSKIDFSIDRSHEMAKYIWNDGEGFALIHDDSFCVEDGEDCSTISQNFNHYCDETRIDPESIYFAVKTYSKFHNDRVPIVLKTWGKQVTNLHFFSDIKDGSIPTINLNVPNTESGHCAKTMAILKYAAKELDKNDRFKWVVLSDDDTLFSIPRLQQFLTCYDPNWIIAIGERYGYNVLSSEGYNYITGGGGTIFSKKMIQLLTKPGNCVCPSPSTPDDMFLGICISKLDGKMVHSPFFHQARPMDYAVNYLKWQTINIISKHIEDADTDFADLILDILLNTLLPFKCVALITDIVYEDVLNAALFKKFGIYLSFFVIRVKESEDLLSPFPRTQASLGRIKDHDCQTYVILIANGLQVSRLLRYGDRYRLLDTRANYIILHDNRLFNKSLHYLWKRIVNVVFIKEYVGIKRTGDITTRIPWFELSTVPFPSPIQNIFVPRRLDIWRKSKFRTGANLFDDKTSDLKNQTMRVIVLQHIPGTIKMVASSEESTILAAVSKAMNFKSELYQVSCPNMDFWGRKQSGGKYTGLIGEMVGNNADIALGDLYYTSYLLELMDLTVPYNTECLTFLTPESLSDNSWKTLILPFKMIMWLLVIFCVFACGIIFHYLALFHCKILRNKNAITGSINIPRKPRIITLPITSIDRLNPNSKYILMKQHIAKNKVKIEPTGLYLFSNFFNSILYSYSMLLMVSLPRLPFGWSLRMLAGWYWLYCTLVAVSYKASMTAILANPAPRVTINTLQELIDSKIPLGGWGEANKELFKTSLDPIAQTIGEKFEFINDSKEAIEKIVKGEFAFYENIYFLKEASVAHQLHQQLLNRINQSIPQDNLSDRSERKLHIMKDCVINMPISIGLQKNSPIKPRVDKYIRRVLEAGFVKKWLDDVMQSTLNGEAPSTLETIKALMNTQKFIGAVVALCVGYFVSLVGLCVEILYFHFTVKKHPNYNKYSRKIY